MSWIGAISLGMNILGGFSARRKARRRARRMKKAINAKIGTLQQQIPDIEKYYDNLDDMLTKENEVEMDRTVEDFTANALDFNTKSESLVESGKGLISGTVNKTISETKEKISDDTGRNIEDIVANFEKTSLQLSNSRERELLGITNAIEDLNIQKASL